MVITLKESLFILSGSLFLITGILLLIQYFKTKRKKFLFLGILFALIVPGIIVYIVLRITANPFQPGQFSVPRREDRFTCYAMAETVKNVSPSLLAYRKAILDKFKDRIPKQIFKKVKNK